MSLRLCVSIRFGTCSTRLFVCRRTSIRLLLLPVATFLSLFVYAVDDSILCASRLVNASYIRRSHCYLSTNYLQFFRFARSLASFILSRVVCNVCIKNLSTAEAQPHTLTHTQKKQQENLPRVNVNMCCVHMQRTLQSTIKKQWTKNEKQHSTTRFSSSAQLSFYDIIFFVFAHLILASTVCVCMRV